MSLMLSSILTVMMAAAAAADTDYCALCADHTMCLYPSEGASSDCPEVLERGVSDDDKKVIIDAHNKFRQDVKNGQYSSYSLPAAQDIPDLTWDDELATIAQRWADQCSPKAHDDCRKVSEHSVGQNVAKKWTPPSTPKDWNTDAVNQWFSGELEDFKSVQTNLTFTFDSLPAGHLTQVVWAETLTVGCGMIGHPETRETSIGPYTFTKRTFVCNYGPAGNFLGGEIYTAA